MQVLFEITQSLPLKLKKNIKTVPTHPTSRAESTGRPIHLQNPPKKRGKQTGRPHFWPKSQDVGEPPASCHFFPHHHNFQIPPSPSM